MTGLCPDVATFLPKKLDQKPIILEIALMRSREFWLRVEQEWAEQFKLDIYYGGLCDDSDLNEEEYESCDYTGEECIGNKLFCEECPVLTDDWEEEG